MRIGIDATPIPHEPVGAGIYIIQLTRALIAVKNELSNLPHEFIIFVHRQGYELINVPVTPGVEWIILPDRSPVHRLLWEQAHLPFIVSRLNIDLLHSLHYTRPAFLPCSSVVTFHDMTFLLFPHLHTRIKRVFFPISIRLSARYSQALIAVSECTRRDSIQLLNISPQKIFTVLNGISEEYSQISDATCLEEIRQKYQLPERFILTVGLIEPRKNLPMLIKAFARLVNSGRSAMHLVIAGRLGWMYKEIFRLIEILGIKDRVQFTGYLPAKDLSMVYNLAQIFVYPSLYEGFGFPPLEAMACGTPVISTSISAMSELIGDAGILVPPQDEVALAKAMQRVLDDFELQKRLSIMGRKHSALFTWKRTALETIEVYQHVETMSVKSPMG